MYYRALIDMEGTDTKDINTGDIVERIETSRTRIKPHLVAISLGEYTSDTIYFDKDMFNDIFELVDGSN